MLQLNPGSWPWFVGAWCNENPKSSKWSCVKKNWGVTWVMTCLTAGGPFHFFWTNAVGEQAGQLGHNTANNPTHQGAPSRLTWVTAEAVLHTTFGSKHVVCRFTHVWHAWQPPLSGHHGCLWLGPLRAFGAADISWNLPPTVENIACNNHQRAGNHTKTNWPDRGSRCNSMLVKVRSRLKSLQGPSSSNYVLRWWLNQIFQQFRQGSSQHQSQMLITSNDQEKLVIHPASFLPEQVATKLTKQNLGHDQNCTRSETPRA